MTISNETIGKKILSLRKQRGVTQAELGESLSISYQAVSKWERGESCPDFNTLSRIAKIFNVPIGYFEEADEEAWTQDGGQAQEVRSMVGVCVVCGKVVYDEDVGLQSPVTCKTCAENAARAEQERLARLKEEQEEAEWEERRQAEQRIQGIKDRRNKGLITGGIIGGVLFVLGLLGSFGGTVADFFDGLLGSIIIGGVLFTYISQLFWRGAVAACTLAGGHIIGTPGVIFTLDLDGVLWLIGVKLFFAVLRFVIWLFTLLICVCVGIVISPFTFFFALKRVNRGE